MNNNGHCVSYVRQLLSVICSFRKCSGLFESGLRGKTRSLCEGNLLILSGWKSFRRVGEGKVDLPRREEGLDGECVKARSSSTSAASRSERLLPRSLSVLAFFLPSRGGDDSELSNFLLSSAFLRSGGHSFKSCMAIYMYKTRSSCLLNEMFLAFDAFSLFEIAGAIRLDTKVDGMRCCHANPRRQRSTSLGQSRYNFGIHRGPMHVPAAGFHSGSTSAYHVMKAWQG